MKTLTAVSAVILVFTLFGCRESLINQPETALETSQNKTSPITDGISNQTITKVIPIGCCLCDPVFGECKIIGKVNYAHKIVDYSAGVATVHLKIEMDSELCHMMMHAGKCTIYGNHGDIVEVDESGFMILEKNYEIRYRPYVRLGVRYKVTRNEIQIDKMVLHQIDQTM